MKNKIAEKKKKTQRISMNFLFKIAIFVKYQIKKIKPDYHFMILMTLTKWWSTRNKYKIHQTEQKELISLLIRMNYKFLMMIMMNIYLPPVNQIIKKLNQV